jgi:hypothetical protein
LNAAQQCKLTQSIAFYLEKLFVIVPAIEVDNDLACKPGEKWNILLRNVAEPLHPRQEINLPQLSRKGNPSQQNFSWKAFRGMRCL